MGEGANGDVLSIAFAGPGQHQDAGAKTVHAAPNTTSTVVSKSISKAGGRPSYRGLRPALDLIRMVAAQASCSGAPPCWRQGVRATDAIPRLRAD